MEKEAWVTALEGDSARIRFFRHAACRNCGGCLAAGNQESEMLIPIPEGIKIKPGDRVIISMASSVFLRTALLVYLVPLFLFFLGYVAGNKLFVLLATESHGEAGGVIGGLFFLFLGFLWLKFFDRRRAASPGYQLRVVNSGRNQKDI